MNRLTTALFAALEAVIAVAVGLGIPLVMLTVMWAVSFGMGTDWLVFWRAGVDLWLVGHGVDLTVQLPAAVAAATGLTGADQPFTIGIAVLGFALLTVVLGVGAGRRAAASRARVLGVLVAAVVFGVLTALVAATAGSAVVTPAHWQSLTLPPLIYLAALVIGSEWGQQRLPQADRDALAHGIRSQLARLPHALTEATAVAARGAAAVVSGMLAVAALALALALVVGYGTVVGLYETLHSGAVGGFALTLLQLALLPNLVIWAAAWLVGPGFALGTASSVTPAGTVVGPLPGLPVLGALPQGQPALGWLGVLVPVLLGIAAGWIMSGRMPRHGVAARIGTGAAIGVLAGLALGLLAWWSAGSLGPGRLAQVGPQPWLVAVVVAVEVGVPAMIGMAASVLRTPDGSAHAEPVGAVRGGNDG